MARKAITLACLIMLGASLAGCTRCGWIWDDWAAKPKSCLPDIPAR